MSERLKCKYAAVFEVYWPGEPRRLACLDHMYKLNQVANAIGFDLASKALTSSELQENLSCEFHVKEA